MDICLRVLKESNKSRFDSYSVRNSVLIISHITFRDCRVHIFSDNLSRNSCIIVAHGLKADRLSSVHWKDSLGVHCTDRVSLAAYRCIEEDNFDCKLQALPDLLIAF